MNEYKEVRLYERMQSLRKQIIVLWAVLIALIILAIAGIILILESQAQIIVQQTDTLDQIQSLRLEVWHTTLPDEWEAEPTTDADPITYQLTPDERDLVERVTAAEARGEDLQGMMAVAQTILDRAELWNMTPTEVVTAPGQYADPYRGDISDEVKLAVSNVFDGGVRVFEEPVTHFYSGPEPYWAADKVNRGSIGRHQFYY